jgi:DNA polymerase I
MEVKAQLAKVPQEDTLTWMILDRRQNALKIGANSVYGITGFVGNKYMGHIPTAESVTSMGRALLESVVHTIQEKFPVEVVYGDTDSCMIHHKKRRTLKGRLREAEKITHTINQGLPPPLKLLVERHYLKMAFLTKKRYLMWDGIEVKSKGVASARRDYCQYTREVYGNTVRAIFEKTPEEVLAYVVSSLDRLVKGEVPLQDLVMTKSIKSLESYTNTNAPHVVMAKRLVQDGMTLELGSRLEYLFAKVPGARLQGQRMYTPQEVEVLELEVDTLYYIEKQLLKALDEILGLIGYGGLLKDLLKSLREAER